MGFSIIVQKITNKFVQKLIEFKLYLIPYPKIPNSSSLGNFFIIKFVIENRYFSKIAPFATLPFSLYKTLLSSLESATLTLCALY
jgi:hypothetical protein